MGEYFFSFLKFFLPTYGFPILWLFICVKFESDMG